MYLRSLSCLAAAAVFSGCALTKATIDVAYTPPPAKAIQGAAGQSVQVKVTDSRPNKDYVSRKKNGYGMEMAPIRTRQPVPSIVARAIESELSGRGFRLGAGGKMAEVDVIRFYSNWELGFWSSTAAAEVTLHVGVRGSGYSKTVTGKERNSGEVVLGAGGTREGLELALADAVRQLMADRAFINALFGRDMD